MLRRVHSSRLDPRIASRVIFRVAADFQVFSLYVVVAFMALVSIKSTASLSELDA